MSAYAVTRAYHFSAAHRLASDRFSDEENAREPNERKEEGKCYREGEHDSGELRDGLVGQQSAERGTEDLEPTDNQTVA